MTLDEFFEKHRKVALAFSGGLDSSYLLHVALKKGVDVRAYYVKTAFQPESEFNDALDIAFYLNAPVSVLTGDVFSNDKIVRNGHDRCYWCKRMIMEKVVSASSDAGYELVIDGTNGSDDSSSRPGMRALEEMKVRSPLSEAMLGKDEIRRLARDENLPFWNKCAYACLATRIGTGDAIDLEKLEKTEKAEDYLSKLGFEDFRVRMDGKNARLEVRREDFARVMEERKEIVKFLSSSYDRVSLDLEARNE